jgi:hypothetical protein
LVAAPGALATDAVSADAPAAAGTTPATPALGVPADPVAAAAAAGLTPFDFPAAKDPRTADLFDLGSNLANAMGQKPISASTAAAIAAAAKPVPAKPGNGDGQDTQPPGGPPGNAGAGGAASGSGSVASGGWCAVLFDNDLLSASDLLPHRCRLVLAAQAGATSLLHRPG